MVRRLGGISALAVVLLVATSLWIVFDRFKVTTELKLFMPPGNTAIERLLLRQLERGATTNLIFASIEGADPKTLFLINKAVSAKLRQSDLVQRVFNGEEGLSAKEQELIFDYRYLLSGKDLEDQFSVEGLRQALSHRLRGLASSTASLEKKYLRNDPTAEFFGLMSTWLGQGKGDQTRIKLHGVWFSRDKQRSLMVIETHTSGLDLGGQARDVGFVNRTFEELSPEGVKLTMTGPSVFAVETRDHLRNDVKLLTVLAIVFVGLFLLMAFRSFLLLFYLLVPLGFGVLVAVATVLLVFDSIHGITLAFGITLTGVAVDYPIHLFSHLDGDRSELKKQMRRIWPTLRLGVITTVIAYAAFVFSDFDGLKQLGLFTVSGLITAAITTRWLLPSVIPANLPLKQGIMRVHGLFERFGRAAPQFRIWASLVVIFAAAYLVLTERPLKDFNVDSMSPIPIERRVEDRQLRRDLGTWYGGKLLIVVAPSAERALQHSESLAEHLGQRVAEGAISGYQMAAHYLPSIKKQKRRIRALPNADQLRSRLNMAVSGLPFKLGLFEPFVTDVQQTRSKALLDIEKVKAFNLGARLAPLLSYGEMGWAAPILLNDVTDPSRFAVMTGKVGDVETFYLDLKSESTKIMTGVIDRVIRLLGWSGLFIYMVLAFKFKSPRTPLRILGPTLASVLVVSALLVYSGTSLNLFHLVSLLLVIGLGLDYSLFFNRLTRHHEEWATTYKALWVCCITTVLVFGMLMLSHASPLQAIGKTVAGGAALCLTFGAIWSSAERRIGPPGRWRAAMHKRYIRRRSRTAMH